MSFHKGSIGVVTVLNIINSACDFMGHNFSGGMGWMCAACWSFCYFMNLDD